MTSRDGRKSQLWRRTRAAWAPAVAAGIVPCPRCGELIEPGTAWDLGHPDELSHASTNSPPEVIARCHPEHQLCNRSARKGRGAAARVVRAPGDGRLW